MSWYDLGANSKEMGPLESLPIDRVDLHARWAGTSRLAGYREITDAAGQRLVTVMVELASGIAPLAHQTVRALIQAPIVYGAAVPDPRVPNTQEWPRFITGTFPLVHLPALAAMTSPAGPVLRWRLGLPQVARPEPARGLGDSLGLILNGKPPLAWIGIIDHGIGVAHRAFRYRDADGNPATRVGLLWDQDPVRHGAALAGWRKVPKMGYGACLTATDLIDALTDHHGDDTAVYRHFGYGPAQFRASHGTHVLDLAAGRPDPRTPRDAAVGSWDGCASHAPILAVQLPYLPNKDTSGAGLGVHVLDALHFMVAHAKAPGTRPDIVVNLSDGAYGGRHDGMSMAEEAIDDFLQTHRQVQLVVAAGNAGDQRLHAVSELPVPIGGQVSIDWQVLPDDTSDGFCEVWFDDVVPSPGTRLTVTPPGGLPAVSVPLGQNFAYRPDSSTAAACAVLSSWETVNHRGRAGFLVAVSVTSWSLPGRTLVPHGRWRLTLANANVPGAKPIDAVHVWVERDSPVGNESGPRRQSRLAPHVGGGMSLTAERTLGSLAGCQQAFVTDGYGLKGCWPVAGLAMPACDVPPYVSRGPGRRSPMNGPDVAAPCEESATLHGLLAAGTRSGTRVRMNGTSVAAPQVARVLVDHIMKLPIGTAPDRAALRQALGRRLHPQRPDDPKCTDTVT